MRNEVKIIENGFYVNNEFFAKPDANRPSKIKLRFHYALYDYSIYFYELSVKYYIEQSMEEYDYNSEVFCIAATIIDCIYGWEYANELDVDFVNYTYFSNKSIVREKDRLELIEFYKNDINTEKHNEWLKYDDTWCKEKETKFKASIIESKNKLEDIHNAIWNK